MMSTFSGLLLGLLIAALVTVMYGPQLSHSVRDAIGQHPSVKALLDRPRAAETSPSTIAEDAITAQATIAPVALDVPGSEAAEETKPAPVQRAQAETSLKPDLEQLWSAYATDAAKLEPEGSFPWQQCFQRSAASYELPMALLLAIASGESNFDPAAHSDKNAIGLMQIRWPLTSRHLDVHRQADLYDPCTNVDAGARYLRELAQHYANNLHLVVAAYNYGPSRVSPNQVPEGALWYSHYIFQHLQRVLGLEPTGTSQLIAAPARPGAGREVLMTFTSAHRARDFVAFLSAQVPGLNLQQQSEALGRHDVVLLHGDLAEKNRALQAMRAAGLEALAQPSNPSFQL